MYDYVIVGAGSAGCVLANRLSEDPDVSVLLLEAGGPDTNDLVHLPAAFSALYRTAQDWDHSTVYEPFANDRRIYLPRGKVLGGSSSINAMIYIRGNPLDYDEWGPGWTWAELLPYFKRSEDNERGESELHGAGGPLPVSDGRSLNPLAQAFVDAAVACGHPANDDFNGPAQDGVGLYQLTQRGGARASAAVAYLHPVLDRPNLTVETHVHALSLVFEGVVPGDGHGFSVGACVLKPKSRGYVALGSPDPTAKPLIVHNYLEHPDDVASMVAGVRMAMEICASEPLASYSPEVLMGPASLSDEDILEKTRANMQTLYHPVGTCAIDAVVDRELRVLGVEGLRVVDASVMPTVPRGN